ncbi:MAG: ABC transporter substrate-binding protein [Candidatus Bathyarchaeia archaeon]
MIKKILSMLHIMLMIASLLLLVFSPIYVYSEEVPNGPWLDEIIFFKEPSESKIFDIILKGEAHQYQWFISPMLFEKVKASPELAYDVALGIFYVLDVNPVPFREGWNPFVNAKMREALNYIIDREYFAYTIMKGAARPKYTILVNGFPDYGEIIDTARFVESKYRFNPETAKEIIYKEMSGMGAVLKEGKWYYKEKPVEIKFIIRVEDQRRDFGDFIATQLEKLGFIVDRQYKTIAEASPIRYGSDPRDGMWHLYTGGYEAGLDQSADFWNFFAGAYLESGATHDPVFSEIARKLYTSDYSSVEEKIDLMRKALLMSVEDSTYIGLVDRLSIFMKSKDLVAASHISAGPWRMAFSRTVRLKNRVGGTIKIANREAIVEEMNPVVLGGWVFDVMIYLTTMDWGFFESPYLNAWIPLRVKEYSVEVVHGVPVEIKPEVRVVESIKVPSDAISGWDVKSKRYTSVGEGKNALVKVTLKYDENLGKYHDGTKITFADFMVWFALGYERADSGSKIYDESSVPGFIVSKKPFIGIRIIRQDPVIVEVYGNYTHTEPSFIANWAAAQFTLNGFPWFPWHALAIGILAEENKEIAFSSLKAKTLAVERTNYMYGPSIDILKRYLDKAISEKYIPEWIRGYVTEDEAIARYQKLNAFYEERKHFWVSCGPFYLHSIDPIADVAVVRAFREYPYKADRFDWLLKVTSPEVYISAPEDIVPGLSAIINVSISTEGEPYPTQKVKKVIYILSDPTGAVIAKGVADATGVEGFYQIKLSDIETAKMLPGTIHIAVYAFSTDIAVPGTAEASTFVIPETSYISLELSRMRAELRTGLKAIESLSAQVSEISGRVSSLNNTVNTAMIMAGVAILISFAAVILLFVRKKT